MNVVGSLNAVILYAEIEELKTFTHYNMVSYVVFKACRGVQKIFNGPPCLCIPPVLAVRALLSEADAASLLSERVTI